MKHSETDGLIYYLLDATRTDLRVKIGYTASLKERLATLAPQTMSRQTPLVLALEAGGTNLERARHDQFHSLRIMGEWFRYDEPLIQHLATLPNPIGWLADHPELWAYTGGWQNFSGWARLYEAQPDLDESEPDYKPLANVQF